MALLSEVFIILILGKETVPIASLLHINEIKEEQLPELDDEFAKDQDYDTVDLLKEGIKSDILARKTENAQHAFEDAVIEKLCENVEGEIPECMYDNKAEENVNNFAQRVQQQPRQ